jgi:opacity protein-like surface antigen
MKIDVLNNRRLAAGAVAVCLAAVSHSSAASDSGTDEWAMRVTAQGAVANYSGADLRDSLYSAGVLFGGDYLERGGFTVGYNYTEVDGKGTGPGTFDTLEEDALYLSGKLHSYLDSLPGRLTWRLDGYLISDDASGGGGSGSGEGVVGAGADADIDVLNPIVAFIDHEKTWAVDLGYAYSNYDYDDSDDFKAHQVTPTVGFALGGPSNWLQLRGYFIHLSEDEVNDGNDDTVALEAKWTHWLDPDAPLGLRSIGVNVLVGERFLAVDPDGAVVFTLADEQQGGIALNGVFALGSSTSLMLQVGYDEYENRALNNDYDSLYGYLNLTHRW